MEKKANISKSSLNKTEIERLERIEKEYAEKEYEVEGVIYLTLVAKEDHSMALGYLATGMNLLCASYILIITIIMGTIMIINRGAVCRCFIF